MRYAVTMPSLGADMDEAKLLEWHIRPGDAIRKNDIIATVETQKAAVSIESFRSGTVLELIGKIDEIIPVGSVIAYMEVENDEFTTSMPAPAAAPPASSPAPENTPTPATTSHPRLRVSPAARRLAGQYGIDLASLQGTGADGAISLQDIEAARTVLAGTDAEKKSTSLLNIRDSIARAMSRSKREIPHYSLHSRLQLDTLVAWIDSQNQTLAPEQRLLLPATLMRAVVLALQANPDMNGYYENGAFQPKKEINLGVTVALKPGGVMTPAILDAHTMTLTELNTAFADIVQRTRSGKLRNREMTDGTVTVTNLGDLGADSVTGIIFPPQVALVGFGRVRKAPVLDGDNVRPGIVLDISLSADHRVSDGIAGSRLLNAISRLLDQPEHLDRK